MVSVPSVENQLRRRMQNSVLHWPKWLAKRIPLMTQFWTKPRQSVVLSVSGYLFAGQFHERETRDSALFRREGSCMYVLPKISL
jgi:hypothetical protein